MNRGEDSRDCFIRWRAALFRDGIANVPYEIGQKDPPSFRLCVPCGFKKTDVQGAM